MKENLILSYLKKKVSLCAFVNPKIPPSFQRTMCFDSSYHASGSDPVKWWGNPFKTARAELGENGKMYFTTDFFLEQSLQKDFKSYIKHCFDSMCFDMLYNSLEPNWPLFLKVNKAKIPMKTRVIWLLGIFSYWDTPPPSSSGQEVLHFLGGENPGP